MTEKKIAIIGGSGLIGSELVKHYGKNNVKVSSSKKNKNYYYLDLSKKINKENFKNFLKNIDVLIYCASIIKEKNKKKLYKFNYLYFKSIINILKNTKVKLVYLSTMSIYPINTDYICHERKKIKIESMAGGFYAYTKYLAEKNILRKLRKNSYLILRLGSIYGLKKKSNLLDRLLYKIRNNKQLFFTKPLTIKLNFLHVNQLVGCIDFLVKRKKNGIYNVGNFNSISLNKLIKKILVIYPKTKIQFRTKVSRLKPLKYFINFSILKLKNSKYKFKKSKEFLC